MIVPQFKIKSHHRYSLQSFFCLQEQLKRKASAAIFLSDFGSIHLHMLIFCRDTVKFHNSFCCWHFSDSCCRDLTKNTLWKVCLFKFARRLSLKGIIVAPFSAWKLCLVTLRVFHLKRSQFLILGVRFQRKGQINNVITVK